MCYPIANLQPHFDVIRRLVPNAGSVYTDLVGNLIDSAVNMTTLRALSFRVKVPVGEIPEARNHSVESLAKRLHIANHDDARELRHACVSLHKINPRGAWCLKAKSDTPPLAIGTGNIAGQPPDALLEHNLRVLRDRLPTTAEIRAEFLTTGGDMPSKGSGAWVRFFADSHTELAAIDTGSFAPHIRAATIPIEQEFRQANLLRLSVWARQLEAQAPEMPQIMHALGLLVTSVRVNRIVLREAAT